MRTESLEDSYLAFPDGAGSHPGVVVIHEASGLNDDIRDICRRFANQNYIDDMTAGNTSVSMAWSGDILYYSLWAGQSELQFILPEGRGPPLDRQHGDPGERGASR